MTQHELIWAPWRLDYILAAKESDPAGDNAPVLTGGDRGCFLCRCGPAGDDRRRLVVARSPRVMVVMNKFPYNNGHLLVAPLRHCAALGELDADDHAELSRTIAESVARLETLLRPEGFNVGLNLGRAAGAGVPGHLHWHIVPRWTGDTNFMPTTAGVRVIPQSLEALWELLTQPPASSRP